MAAQVDRPTTYDYDIASNLRRVDLPNGTVVEHLVDPADRRIGKKVDGACKEGDQKCPYK